MFVKCEMCFKITAPATSVRVYSTKAKPFGQRLKETERVLGCGNRVNPLVAKITVHASIEVSVSYFARRPSRGQTLHNTKRAPCFQLRGSTCTDVFVLHAVKTVPLTLFLFFFGQWRLWPISLAPLKIRSRLSECYSE